MLILLWSFRILLLKVNQKKVIDAVKVVIDAVNVFKAHCVAYLIDG